MNKIKAIIAGGPPAVLTVAAGGWLVRDEIHYFLRASVLESVGMVIGTAAAALWVRKLSKGKAAPQEPQKATEAPMVVWDLPTALPKAKQTQRPEWLQAQQREAQRQPRN